MVKRVLIILHGHPFEDKVLELACSLAKDYPLHATIVHPKPNNPDAKIEKAENDSAQLVRTIIPKTGELLHENTNPLDGNKGFYYTKAQVDLDDYLVNMSKYYDMVMLSRLLVDEVPEYGQAVIHSLFDAGASVLMVPKILPSSVGYHIAVGWDGSKESLRAIKQGLPMLVKARKVTIITVGSKVTKYERLHLEHLFNLYGIDAKHQHCKTITGSVTQTILKACHKVQADMLITGAFTNSGPLKQRIFGGTTQDMLHEAKIPLLMTH